MCYNPNCNNYQNFNTVCPGCNPGGHCQNFNTTGLLCNTPVVDFGDYNTCGCKWNVPSDCCFYTGSTTSCLGINTNTTLTNVIKKLDQAFCTIVPPSGVTCTAIIGQSGQIVATGVTPSGNQCSAYNISIAPTIINQINTNTTNIATLSGQIGNVVSSITTNTPASLDISNPSTGVYSIDFIPPASGFGGILYSDYTDSTTANTSWTTVKSYPVSGGTLSTNGDEIIATTKFVCSTPILSPGTAPSVRIQFNGITLLSVANFDISNLNSMDWEILIVRISNTAVKIILKYVASTDTNAFYSTFSTSIISYLIDMAGLDLTNNTYSIDCDIKSATAGDTTSKFLKVALNKKI